MSINNKLIKATAFINGREIRSKKTFDVINPATGKTLIAVADLSIREVEKSVDVAAKAWESWKQVQALTRAEILRKWYELVLKHADELAEIMTLESGKPLAESKAEVVYGSSFINWFAAEATRAYGDQIPAPEGQQFITIKQPVGVAVAITPWNFPLAMITRKVAPALAAGCTVILKPAGETPLTAIALAHLAKEAGVPDGVFNVVTSGDSAAVGKLLSTHKKVRKVSFTGSTAVGKILMEQAASSIKKLSFELGGNAPFLVFDDADIDAAVKGAIAAKFRNSGQVCVAVNRFLVHERVFDAFAEKITKAVKALKVGNGLDKKVQVGPLINQAGLEKVEDHIQDAVEKGAVVLTGAKHLKGLFYEPTVLANVPLTAKIAKEETFGPVVSLFKFKTEEEGIRIANDTEFGLAAYFYSEHVKRCWRVGAALEAGMVGINEAAISNAAAPFGGVKESGLGREGSKYGIDEFMEIKYLCFGLA